MFDSYDPPKIEEKWQHDWQIKELYRTEKSTGKPKFYCLDFFPYPSGDGLHVGHCRNYIPTDVLSRFMRMRGYSVLHPMGWDSFGEPTEHYAVTHGVHPRETTDRNTENFRRQMQLIGTSYDWSREIDSSKPEFYRWTQWFFTLLYRRGLAYRDTNWQWWCPVCQTTLSAHEVVGGRCWRGHQGVVKREIPAWYFRITAYADALLDGLEHIDWPDRVKTIQRNWIGRSEGAEIVFTTEKGTRIPVFTTRPDTLFGTTFFVLAPEHDLVDELTSDAQRIQVERYREKTTQVSEIDRSSEKGEKSGLFTGGYVINPINGERVPVWVADYVLPSYGSGAVMGVPAHDQRDFEFARKHDIPVKVVVSPPGHSPDHTLQEAFLEGGEMINSGRFNGLMNEGGGNEIMAYLEEKRLGGRKVQYRIRDWLISRQRYWGTPIPIVYCDDCGETLLPEEQLPVLLPAMTDFQPDGSGRSPLARLPNFVHTTCPKCGGNAQRETDTMGGFACSSWYFLRFTSPHYDQGPFDPDEANYWMPVDLYVGGVEHAVLHLLYARFWTHFLADEGLIPFKEPFSRLLNQGQLMGPDGVRMSKSRGNVVTPDKMVAQYGADALRVYELFMAPFDQDVHWSEAGIQGSRRFLNKIWNLYSQSNSSSTQVSEIDPDIERELHKTIREVSRRIEELRFNTLISTLMEFVNLLSARFQSGTWQTRTYQRALETLMVLLAPIVPHVAEELWELTGHEGSIHIQKWPDWDENYAFDQVIEFPVQVNGKVRAVLNVPSTAGESQIKELAVNETKIKQYLRNGIVRQVIYVPGKIMNILVDKDMSKE